MARSYCYQCQRVKEACFCHDVIQIDNAVSVIVLQHADESRINKGSAVIAKLSLKNYQCWQGEDFSHHAALNQLLDAAAGEICLLYPDKGAQALPLSDPGPAGEKIKYLIVIDATWRKAKKIWSLSTNLHRLTRFKLGADIKSNYRIRKVPEDGYVSTIEAITYSLAALEQRPLKYQPMLALFDAMIDFQIEKMGPQTYDKNYTDKK
ncbi:MAG: DTW domain-containing protein [Gammaproteobacteria bacterium]|nr:DTW domain-containing protein [Gammaproteobacteria bacterium]